MTQAAFAYQKDKSLFIQVIYPFQNFLYFVLANIVLGLIITLAFSDWPDSVGDFLISVAWNFAIAFTQWLGQAYIATQISRYITWKERPWLRAFVSVFAIVVYAPVAFLVVLASIRYFVYGIVPKDLTAFLINNGTLPLIISFVIALFLAARGFYKAWIFSEREAQQYKEEMMNFRYEALRNQINPHFLFNSFNVLSDLVYEDQDLAVKFIHQLSDLYRYVLDSREKERILLATELEFIKAYVFLLKIRFEDKLQIEIDVEANADEYIVPMTLQLLIENAVKHNEASKLNPLHVTIKKTGDTITVENGLKIRTVGVESKNTGLKNISQQYGYLSNREVVVEQTADKFRVMVPVISGGKE